MATKLFDDKTVSELLAVYERTHSPIADISEFREDVMRFTYIQRIIQRYQKTDILNYQLLLNHIIILYNVFESRTAQLLIDSCDDSTFPYMIGILDFLERLPLEYEDENKNTKIINDLNELVYETL